MTRECLRRPHKFLRAILSHTGRVHNHKADYFIWLQYKGFSSVWELLTAAEGEDSVSSLEAAGKAFEKPATSGLQTVTETKR